MNGIPEKVSLRKRLILALLGIPAAAFIGLLVVGVFEIIGEIATKIDLKAQWWSILIVAFILSFIYAFTEDKIRQNWTRKKWASALMLYWEARFYEKDRPELRGYHPEITREELIYRLKVWAWPNPEYWSRCFPEEKYSENPFGIVDSLMAKYEKWAEERKSRRTK